MKLDIVNLNQNLADAFPDLTTPIFYATTMGINDSKVFHQPIGGIASPEDGLNPSMAPLFRFLDKYFDPRRDVQKVKFDEETLSAIKNFAECYKRIQHLTDYGNRLDIFLDMARLEQMHNAMSSTELFEEYTEIFDRLSNNFATLLIDEQSYSNPVLSEPEGNTRGSLDYMALRSRFGSLVSDGNLSRNKLISYYESKANELKECLDAPKESMAISLAQFNDAAQLVRAGIKDLSAEERATFRDDIKRASAGLLKSTRSIFSQDQRIARAELRGFLKSLTISPELAKNRHGGFLETAMHSYGRFSKSVGFAKMGKYVGIYGGIGLASDLLSKVSIGSGANMTVTASSLAVGLLIHNDLQPMQNIIIASQKLDPRRPNAPALMKNYAVACKSGKRDIYDANGEKTGTRYENPIHGVRAIGKVGAYDGQVSLLEGEVPDPSTVEVDVPEIKLMALVRDVTVEPQTLVAL